MRLELKTFLFIEGNITILAIQTCMEQLGFIITIGKTEDLKKPEIQTKE